jgi:PncC family amidohydrolase
LPQNKSKSKNKAVEIKILFFYYWRSMIMNQLNRKNHQLAKKIVQKLQLKNLSVSFAESCTGGRLSQTITSISGSSAVFNVGFVTYANEAKIKYLGVKEKTLDTHGAVSLFTAKEMAEGLYKNVGADICITITGIAGPTGGTTLKPVGTIYIGLARKRCAENICEKPYIMVKKLKIPPNYSRDKIQKITIFKALKLIEKFI